MLSSLFFKLSPIVKFKIKGNSMSPYLKNGDTVIVSKIYARVYLGQVIVFKHPTPPHLFCKRIVKIENDFVFVEGDNKKESFDSRVFGPIKKKNIIGEVLFKLWSG